MHFSRESDSANTSSELSTDRSNASRQKKSAERQESESVCPECFGTGTKIDPLKGAVACPCRRADRLKRLVEVSRIPSRYFGCSLDNFKAASGSSQQEAFLYAGRLVLDYPVVDRGLLFMGPTGVGKTHLAVAIMKGLLEKGFACLFYEFGSLLKEIQDSYNPISKSSELKVLAPVFQADLLVLDELGATVPTDWVRDTMYQIINKRYNDRKVTIFTTNYVDDFPVVETNPEDAPTQRTFSRKTVGGRMRDVATLEERIGTRLRSRLYEMCREVKMDGEDYRKYGQLRT